MSLPKELSVDQLYRRCSLDELPIDSTRDLEALEGLLGQPRAVEAVEFGGGIEREGYNIFAFGPDGTGKHSAVRQMLNRRASARPVPPDLCHVYNFRDPHRPRLLSLPAGKGRTLRECMERLAEELPSTLQAAVDDEAHQARREQLKEQFEERQAKALEELGEEASGEGLALVRTPLGMVFAPAKDDNVLSPEEFQQLAEPERQRLQESIEKFKETLHKVMRRVPRWKREAREQLRELSREVTRYALGPLLDEARERLAGIELVADYLDDVAADIVANARRLSSTEDGPRDLAAVLTAESEAEPPLLHRYRVNLLVDHSESEGAPVVYEDNPTYQNLVGRIEHIPKMGTLVTDFTLIKAGALHRANGGYLLLDALKLLRLPYAWEGLKRALRSKQIKIEGLAEALSLISTYSLQPEPAELSVKIVLLGSPYIYYVLSQLDPDFGELFKVAADFAEEMDWTPENAVLYTRLIAKLAEEKDLKPFERPAVERVIEQGARSVSDQRKLSLYMGKVLDLMREADYWAGKAGRSRVAAEDVERAVEARIFRADRIRQRIQEEMERGSLLIQTDDEEVGQINGLAVLTLNDFSFGRASRITARVRLGKGEVVNIEREVELSGPIHSKGVLILAGFLGSRFAAERPLSLTASLVFEQSYSGVDGDSASAAELYALLSAISGAPLRQSLAVTGSVNQRGDIQAIGGVNEKIEGFFHLCAARGLTGEQGVLIPAANVEHLMLRREVIEAVAAGSFHVYPVEHVDQGIELLTGLPAGVPDESGVYPDGSINRRVQDRLERMARAAQKFAGSSAQRGDDGADAAGDAG